MSSKNDCLQGDNFSQWPPNRCLWSKTDLTLSQTHLYVSAADNIKFWQHCRDFLLLRQVFQLHAIIVLSLIEIFPILRKYFFKNRLLQTKLCGKRPSMGYTSFITSSDSLIQNTFYSISMQKSINHFPHNTYLQLTTLKTSRQKTWNISINESLIIK